MDGASDTATPTPPDATGDPALWKRLTTAEGFEAVAAAWAPLVCTQVAGARAASVFIEAHHDGPLRPVAAAPAGRVPAGDAVAAAESAVAQGRGVVRGAGTGGPERAADGPVAVAVPLLVDGHAQGAAAIELDAPPQGLLRRAMRGLQWGAAWLRDALRAEVVARERRDYETVGHALHVVVAAAEHEGFEAACRAAATHLTSRFDCDRVAVGMRRFQRTRVRAISNSAQFGRQMNLVRLLAAAMDEAVDQRAVVLHPEERADDPVVSGAAAALARAHGASHVLTVPLYAVDRFVGAVTFERAQDRPFTQAEAETLEAAVTVLAPVLEEKRANDRWLITRAAHTVGAHVARLLGPGRVARKLLALAFMAVVAFFWFARDTYRVTADATVEGTVQRAITAPFDGFVAAAPARAGDRVAAGEMLARLDDRDLALERLRLVTERRRRQLEYERAVAARDRAEANIKQIQIRQADARIELIDARIARAPMRAPFDGLVVAGDLSQSIGAAVARGEVLLEVAPLDDYRVVMEVEERVIDDVEPGQTGTLLAAALPNTPIPIEVEKVTPVARYGDGRTTFEVEAAVTGDADRLRPGMQGAAKIDVEEQRLIAIWTRPLLDWLRLHAWRWSG